MNLKIILVMLTLWGCTTAPYADPESAILPLSYEELTNNYDRNSLSLWRKELDHVHSFLEKNKQQLFYPKGLSEVLSKEQRTSLRNLMEFIYNHFAAIYRYERRFADYNHLPNDLLKQKAFFRYFEAYILQYKYALIFIQILEPYDDLLNVILNEKSDETGLPVNSFAHFKFYFLHLGMASRFVAFNRINEFYERTTGVKLPSLLKKDVTFIWRMGKGEGIYLTFKNAVTIINQTSKKFFFPMQKKVASWMGDVKVWRPSKYLITKEQIKEMAPLLAPGDVLFERRDWYLSNIALPGYWPHMALYLGDLKQIGHFFKEDNETLNWVKQQGEFSGDFVKLLSIKYPQAIKYFQQKNKKGHTYRVIEAISEGVSFTSLEFSAKADSLAVLRPKLSKVELARAILLAFSHLQKPYDFDFDILTDRALVCSELIYKSFEPSSDFKGLRLPFMEVLGRKSVAPNEVVKVFDKNYQTGNNQFDFILFLDAHEPTLKSLPRSVKDFRESWKRSKWFSGN